MPLASILRSKAETLLKRSRPTGKGLCLFRCCLIQAIESSMLMGFEILNTMGKSLRAFPTLPYMYSTRIDALPG